MIPALVSFFLLATSVTCVPVLTPGHGTVHVRENPNKPVDHQPATTLSPLNKRQGATYIEYESDNPNDPNSWKPVTTYIQGGGGDAVQTAAPQTPSQATTPTAPTDTTNSDTSGSNPNDGSPLSDGVSLLTTINKWRSAYSVGTLTWSPALADAAANTGRLNIEQGGDLAHHAPDNTAEVITPGSDNDHGQDLQGHSPFEISYLAWLCEVQDDTVGDLCALQQGIMTITYSSTGHHDILTDNQYKQIGCAYTSRPNPDQWFLSQGLWVCDLT